MNERIQTYPVSHTLGYPRVGEHRELKKAAEAYWHGKAAQVDLEAAGRHVRAAGWLAQKAAGIDLIPSNDFSHYDQVLDLTCLVGNVPRRFGWDGGNVDLSTYFAIARGVGAAGADCGCGRRGAAVASEMTKWFDTNYHYIVPELGPDTRFSLSSGKPFDEFTEALALGIRTKPVFVGPVTYLRLGKAHGAGEFDMLSLLPRLLPVYAEVLRRLADLGADWVQFDEPVFSLDLAPAERAALGEAYRFLAGAEPRLRLLVANYFGALGDNLEAFTSLPVAALHADLVRAPGELDALLGALRAPTKLSLGVVDGRNVWRADYARTKPLVERVAAAVGPGRLLIAPSCSLLHVPLTLRNEPALDAGLRSWLAFAEEKLGEVSFLRDSAAGISRPLDEAANRAAADSRRSSPRIHRQSVKLRAAAVTDADARRASPFEARQAAQRRRLSLPPFPTTTIGSFPQTDAVRAARARWKKGAISTAEYEAFLEVEIGACVDFQEEIGIDMPVHGEFERNDMVEYFGERLRGFAFSSNGWVQSYGSRCVKPPILFGDVDRPGPMTVRWSAFAQSLTPRPMKGMLTGPVTILEWSFVRDDQDRSLTALQIALALRDEAVDLEKAGIAAVQIDEPALREGLPLRRAGWPAYLEWAVRAFRVSAAGVRDETQVHTHMCYAEFNDIIVSIAALDADVITIETSRSAMELLDAFATFRYPNEIGPGVYDIHSPRVPGVEEMVTLMRKALAVIPAVNLWVNPDCGLKTRGWDEVRPALANMVAAARILRAEGRHRPAPG
ncbi:MAG TPA: 5-methyltetrahydropteroyltriglutamate--homocysteine S-methyltransferase [Opitutaceae bacterium]|jgi:5-methyltetrahydropteroyltriglutamate--homocysteine methyltransferase